MITRTVLFSINLAVEYNPIDETESEAIDRRLRDFESDEEIRYLDSDSVDVYEVDEDDTGFAWDDLTTEYEHRFTCEVDAGGFKYKAEIVQDRTIPDCDAWVYGKIYPSDEEGFENCSTFEDKFYSLSEAQYVLELELKKVKIK